MAGGGRKTSGWSLRTRLTGLAAGAVATALLAGGPFWLWAVEYGMLADLRERDRERVLRQVYFHVRVLGPMRFEGVARRPALPIEPYLDSNLLVLTPDGDAQLTGEGEAPNARLEEWLASQRDDPSLSRAAETIGGIILEAEEAVQECFRGAFFEQQGEGLLLNLPTQETMDACRTVIDRARAEASRRAEPLQWPQSVVALPDGGRRLRTAIVVQIPGDPEPYALALDSSLDALDTTLEVITRSLVFGGPLLVAFVAGLAWLLVGRSLRVVGDLQREAEQIAFGTLERRLEVPPADDEVRRLVVSLNRMLDRVAEGARRQRAFVGDASHELRSPIAALRAQLEVGLAHPEEADWPRRAGDATEEVIRMQRLVEDLLRMARLDEPDVSGDSPPRPVQDADLDDVVRSEAAALGKAKVALLGVSPVRVRGVEPDLRRVVRNLLENAERYGKGRIQVSLNQRGDEALLEIEDDGPGIPPEQRERVFARFTRLDRSRSRVSGGAGIGLSLARGLVQEHGGDIWIAEGRMGGARLVVVLPVDPERASSSRSGLRRLDAEPPGEAPPSGTTR
mgnify:CR=1 FL=1